MRRFRSFGKSDLLLAANSLFAKHHSGGRHGAQHQAKPGEKRRFIVGLRHDRRAHQVQNERRIGIRAKFVGGNANIHPAARITRRLVDGIADFSCTGNRLNLTVSLINTPPIRIGILCSTSPNPRLTVLPSRSSATQTSPHCCSQTRTHRSRTYLSPHHRSESAHRRHQSHTRHNVQIRHPQTA